MNEEILTGKWKELKGRVKETWGKLTDDDLDEIAGRGDELEGKLQERYGMARDEAKDQIKKFANSI